MCLAKEKCPRFSCREGKRGAGRALWVDLLVLKKERERTAGRRSPLLPVFYSECLYVTKKTDGDELQTGQASVSSFFLFFLLCRSSCFLLLLHFRKPVLPHLLHTCDLLRLDLQKLLQERCKKKGRDRHAAIKRDEKKRIREK